MNEKQLFRALEYVDEEFITEALDEKKKTHPARKWWAVAACLALVCAVSISAVALSDAGVHITEYVRNIFADTGEVETGYDIAVNVEKIPQSDIRGSIVEKAVETIRQQIKDYQPFMSWTPNHYMERMDSAAQAVEFIGYEPLKLPDFGWPQTRSTVNAYGNGQGDLQNIWLETSYELPGVRMHIFACIYTEHYEGEISTGVRTLYQDGNFTDSEYITPNGTACLIVRSDPTERGHYCLDSYYVADNVFYNFYVVYDRGEEALAERILCQWLDEY